jgi:NAD+ kinase
MDAVIDKGIRVNLRMRFTCTVYRAVSAEDEPQSGAGGTGKGKGRGGGKGGVKAVRKEGGEILMSEVGKTGWEALEGGAMSTSTAVGVGKEGEKVKKKDKPVMCFTTRVRFTLPRLLSSARDSRVVADRYYLALYSLSKHSRC